jgi:glycosyltransferase involved in cell wall biosynthesis
MNQKVTVFMLSDYKGWILEATVRESALACSLPINLVFIPNRKRNYLRIKDLAKFFKNRRPQGNCLFVNQNTYFKIIKDSIIEINPQQVNVFYTHYSEGEFTKSEQSKILGKCNKIFTYNSFDKIQLINSGIDEKKIEVVFGGINREIYFPQITKKNKDYVLITGDCKERKCPSLIFEVISKMQKVNFIIHGRGWNEYCRKFNISKSNNLKILDFRLKRNPELIRNASAYLSLSKLEAGPYTAIEALASGTPVVVTSTGWNPEIVNDSNGILLPLEFKIEQVIKSLETAMLLKEKVRGLDLIEGKFTWKRLGQIIYSLN